jgi:hypothetical protein
MWPSVCSACSACNGSMMGDVNNDGRDDVVVAMNAAGGLAHLLAAGAGLSYGPSR